jgi:hypothetical protein
MRALLRPRVWFVVTAVLAIVGLFLLDGPISGVVLFFAGAAFIVACFRALSGESPEDRTAGTGLFGGGGW